MSALSDTVVRVEQCGEVRRLVLNRPRQRNALNAVLVDALTAAVIEAEHDPATRAVLVTGAGPGFCAGADLRHLLALSEAGESPVPFLRTVSGLTRRIELSPLPVVAVLHGHAIAGGLELALACDAVLAETGTLIGDGHLRNHLVPGAGSAVRMRRKLGDSLGRWLGLTGELLPAERFLAAGWLHAVVEPGHGVDEGLRVAGVLAAASNPAQAAFKRMFGVLDDEPAVEAGLRLELDEFDRHWSAHDVPDQLRRFFAGRPS
ncbi:enoyl-CoA hydratase/isomerase family protein [Amycolatopsis magusensis]|uniref:Enoyl-CoA hydratase/carnithine racemase n=1 Tax=Amycolatopsis magusensis TaxID=882444 RepID=A0ABS4PZS0_9PSEU|nr:enoyl-CoA hydratase/isomerase family protein [Amycolatopsis magusensis]MBP2184359.1 enoyl-CoA hydratase/carnithine racemase [Amycolatopsis magusensis]